MRSAVIEDQRVCPPDAEGRCACGGSLVVLAGDYVSRSHCISCGESRLLAWVSCRPITLGCVAEMPAAAWPSAGRPW